MLVVVIAMGVVIVATARLAGGTDLRAERRSDLAGLIVAEEARVAGAAAEVEVLRDDVERLSGELDTSRPSHRTARDEQVAAAAGLTEVTGAGVSVTLTDAPIPEAGIPEGFAPDDYVVHQADIQAVVNALWAGGAEAITVMDQRIITTSAVRCVGNTLILKGRVYSPPYTVAAVGPTERMERALDVSPGVTVYRQYAELIGLGYEVAASDEVVAPAYEGLLQLRYVQVAL